MSRLALAIFLSFWPLAALAEAGERLWAALQMDEALDVIAAEYRDYGIGIGDVMLDGGGGSAWQAVVMRIVDTKKMRDRLQSELSDAVQDIETAPLFAFLEGDQGQRLVAAEIAARRAMLNEGAEELALEAYGEAPEALIRQLEGFARVNGLATLNLQGALNSDVAFYRGLVEGGVFRMSEEEILAEVSGRLSEVEQELEDWLDAYLFLSFKDVPEGDLKSYTEFSETKAGHALNGAIFEAFGALNLDMSYAFGLAVSVQMIGEKL